MGVGVGVAEATEPIVAAVPMATGDTLIGCIEEIVEIVEVDEVAVEVDEVAVMVSSLRRGSVVQ